MKPVYKHFFWVVALCAMLSGCAGMSGSAYGNNHGVSASANVLHW